MIKTLGRIAAALSIAACVFAYAKGQSVNASQETTARAGVVSFRGSLGAKSAIQMRLRREDDKLAGSYFYESVGKDLSLRGTIDAAGNFNLQEFDAAGAQTGLFKGTWKGPQCEDCVDSLSGKWTRPVGPRPLEFSLNEFPVSFAGDTRPRAQAR